jgi:DNA/RNA-binding domain of Phe-tRNA-synthetase-like protein
MRFQHSPEIWAEFPELVPGVLFIDQLYDDVRVDDRLPKFHDRAAARLAEISESDLPEINAWRRAFSRMGLKPTQYRCSAESLLRRFKREGAPPSIHPLVDLCNALSMAFAIPMAVIDTAKVVGHLEVRHATGAETYLTFAEETEHPAPGGRVHRRGRPGPRPPLV